MGVWHARFVRAALLYLVYAGFLGTLFYFFPGMAGPFRLSHVHAGFVGFLLQMVMGVAYWMMPRPGGMRQEGLEAWTFFLLNAGLLLRLVAEPLFLMGWEGLRPILPLSGLLQLAAILVFAYAMSQRVVTAETLRRLREERERQASNARGPRP